MLMSMEECLKASPIVDERQENVLSGNKQMRCVLNKVRWLVKGG